MYSPILIVTNLTIGFGTMLSPLWRVLLISCSFISFIFSLVLLSFRTSVNTFFKFLAKCLIFFSKLWCVITQLSQNRSRRYLSSFLLYFYLNIWGNTLVYLIISLRGNQPATHGMLQKKNHKRLQKTYLTKYEIVIKDDYLRS